MTRSRKTLQERFEQMPLAEQMGNIGSEVSRATYFKNKNNPEQVFNCIARALELTDSSIKAAQKNKLRGTLKELCLMREVMCDYFLGNNEYNINIKSFQNYFTQFAIAAALKKGK